MPEEPEIQYNVYVLPKGATRLDDGKWVEGNDDRDVANQVQEYVSKRLPDPDQEFTYMDHGYKVNVPTYDQSQLVEKPNEPPTDDVLF